MLTNQQILKPRVGLAVVVGLVVLLLVDVPRLISVGPTTLSGAITIGLTIVLVLLAPMAFLARWQGYSRKVSTTREPFIERKWTAVPWPLVAFVVYAVVTWVERPSITGLQNVAVYVAFALAILLTATFSSAGTAGWVMSRYGWAGFAATVAFIVTSQIGVELYGERAYASVALVYLAVLVPIRSKNVLLRIAPYLVVIALVLSLSRTAAVIGLLLLVFLVVRRSEGNAKRVWRGLLLLAVLAAAAVIAVWNYAPFRDRFFGGDNAVQLDSGLTFNTSGRDQLWGITIKSWQQNPWFGNGPGSAQDLITPLFKNISHPHNEYLRLLHDFGIFGLVFFCLGMLWILRGTFRRARAYDEPHHWAAFLALTAVLLLSATDNPLIYQFVMMPVGALVGISLASPPPKRRSAAVSPRRAMASALT